MNPSVNACDEQQYSHGVKAVVGPGTGIGEAFLAKTNGDLYETFPSEGGHVNFTIQN